MDDHTTLTVHIDTTAMPDGHDQVIRAAITTTTGKALPDIDLTMLVLTTVTAGAAPRVAAALAELMNAGPTPAHRFAFTVAEEPAHERPGQILRYTPDTGLVSDARDGDGQPPPPPPVSTAPTPNVLAWPACRTPGSVTGR